MTLVPELQIGLYTGWWFSVIFGLVNLGLIVKYPRDFSRRLFKFPEFKSRTEKILSMISVVVFTRGLIIYTIFVPFASEMTWFYVGISIFCISLVFYLIAVIKNARHDILGREYFAKQRKQHYDRTHETWFDLESGIFYHVY